MSRMCASALSESASAPMYGPGPYGVSALVVASSGWASWMIPSVNARDESVRDRVQGLADLGEVFEAGGDPVRHQRIDSMPRVKMIRASHPSVTGTTSSATTTRTPLYERSVCSGTARSTGPRPCRSEAPRRASQTPQGRRPPVAGLRSGRGPRSSRCGRGGRGCWARARSRSCRAGRPVRAGSGSSGRSPQRIRVSSLATGLAWRMPISSAMTPGGRRMVADGGHADVGLPGSCWRIAASTSGIPVIDALQAGGGEVDGGAVRGDLRRAVIDGAAGRPDPCGDHRRPADPGRRGFVAVGVGDRASCSPGSHLRPCTYPLTIVTSASWSAIQTFP